MSTKHTITIGTRGSQLALKQTGFVVDAISKLHPSIKTSVKVITTKGDSNQSPIPLDTIGKAWFTEEIEDALQSGLIDLAVHSLKDLPPEVPTGLTVAAVLERDDPRDVVVSKSLLKLDELPKGATVGTDSIRRKAQILAYRPDVVVASVRGNINTRLRKLQEEDYDALVLAAAGLRRLGLQDSITEYLDPTLFVPAVGQGVLAVEARQDHPFLWDIIKDIQDQDTLAIVEAEQTFSRAIGGGCKLPIGCYAYFKGQEIVIHAMVGSMDALTTVHELAKGPRQQAPLLATQLAENLLEQDILTTLETK